MAWAGALGWLAWRLHREGDAEVASASLRIPPGAAYYRVTAGGRRLGLASLSVDTLPDGLRVSTQLALDFSPTDSADRLVYAEDIRLSRTLRLLGFRTRLAGAYGSYRLDAGWIAGDSALALLVQGDGTRGYTLLARVPAQVALPWIVPFRVAFGARLKIGRTATYPVFDPVTLDRAQRVLRITGDSTLIVPDSAAFDPASRAWKVAGLDTVRAWRIAQVEHGVPTTTWVDAAGYPVLRETALGVRFERTAFELARDRGAAPSREPRDVDAGVRRSLVDSLRRGTLMDSATRADALADAPLLRLPKLRRRARALVPDTADQAGAALALAKWVAANVADQPQAPVLLPADSVAALRAGSADQRAELFVALARSIGIPARAVAGVVRRDGADRVDAWAEVLLGQWVPVDVRRGILATDPDRVTLVAPGRAHPLALLPLAGGMVPSPDSPPGR